MKIQNTQAVNNIDNDHPKSLIIIIIIIIIVVVVVVVVVIRLFEWSLSALEVKYKC